MKIAILNWQDPYHPFAGGAEYHLYEYFRRLLDIFEVYWFGCRGPEQTHYEQINGIHYYRNGKWQFANLSVGDLYRKMRAKIKPDIVFESITKVPFYSPLYEKKIPITVFIPHLFGRIAFQETNPILATYVWSAEKLIPMVYRNRFFFVDSDSTRDDIIDRGIKTIDTFISSPGIDPDEYNVHAEKEKDPLILSLGRVKKYKRIDLSIRAFAKLKERIPTAQMAIVGGGDYIEPLKKFAHEIGLLNNGIQFTEQVSLEEKVRWFKRAWVLVNTSPKEGWGMVNTEAQYCGTPVVAFNSPGIRDSVCDGETGFLLPFSDIDGLADKMYDIITNEYLRVDMGKSSVKLAENFFWNKLAQKFRHDLLTVCEYYNLK